MRCSRQFRAWFSLTVIVSTFISGALAAQECVCQPYVVLPQPTAQVLMRPVSWQVGSTPTRYVTVPQTDSARTIYAEPADFAPRLEPYAATAYWVSSTPPIQIGQPVTTYPMTASPTTVMPIDLRSRQTVSRPVTVSPAYRPYAGQGLLRPIRGGTATPASYVMGRGLIGQPKVYVPGQPIMNFLRYLTP